MLATQNVAIKRVALDNDGPVEMLALTGGQLVIENTASEYCRVQGLPVHAGAVLPCPGVSRRQRSH
jgi:hypothetical protein